MPLIGQRRAKSPCLQAEPGERSALRRASSDHLELPFAISTRYLPRSKIAPATLPVA